ncbi:heavy-metal-associated domain-containing protein [Halodesulfurarchaeum sp. HSR-GB]|uniref:heavy-metal-associated domain-containing protein n=1 Tax=Halodesulfurarchaeum sp. HSR-GB TaxID=3074077 RepID=UPI002864E205|nr:heavy-metal-associated domain-containing protein [Halodesulfurarchaeum sp. HSR-GB]MDR5657073.1 heavy-metal-associated domain-containing protein [Halodesulfurarchaeum sp. HSR-GB]
MSITLRVEDMSCDGCEDIVETALEEVSGVEEASADHEANTAVVEGDADVEDLLDAVDYAGYTAEFQPGDEAADEQDESEE